MKYRGVFSTKATPQSQPIPGTDQVPNSGGGYAYPVDDWKRLDRFLGPEYTSPDQLEQLRSRGLGAKRSLALREFALGVEALERFVRGESLTRVHECVFGVLSLESEPVDSRP